MLEKPAGVTVAEVVVTFLPTGADMEDGEGADAPDVVCFAEDAAPLDDFEPIVPRKPILLSDIVLEDRR